MCIKTPKHVKKNPIGGPCLGLIVQSAPIFLIFFVGTSVTKRFARSNIFMYGLPQDILSKKQGREGRTATPPPCFKGLTNHECNKLSGYTRIIRTFFFGLLEINLRVTNDFIYP